MAWVTGRVPTRRNRYGSAHQADRRAWGIKVKAGGVRCGMCGRPILPGQAWDLDHVVPVALGGIDGQTRPVHRSENRRAGARLGVAISKLKRSA